MSIVALSISRPNNKTIQFAMAILLVAVLLISMSIGNISISIKEIINILLTKTGLASTSVEEVKTIVFWNIRLPRLVQTVLIGGVLGVSGAALQGIFRNPLVEPGLIGVSTGAALGAVLVITFGHLISAHFFDAFGPYILPVMAFFGGLITTVIVYLISQSVGKTNISLILLAGIAVTALTSALIGLVLYYADDAQIRAYNFWTMGDLSAAHWPKILITLPFIVIPIAGLLTFSKALNAIALGEAQAFHLGIPVERVKYLIIIFSALGVGAAVSLAGIVGFIGLVIPHLIRMLFGADHKIVLPGSILGGAILLLIADLIARQLVAPSELPIGIVTALLGTPFFIFLIIQAKKKHLI